MREPEMPNHAALSDFPAGGETRRKDTLSPEEIQGLRIREVHLQEDMLLCRLSNGQLLQVPISISPALAAAPHLARFQWRISGDGKAVFWYTEALKAHVSLREMLDAPDSELAGITKE
jgi:hypothetical protein